MAHLHEVRDDDTHFIVDPESRTIRNATSSKLILIQNDHNSEILTFEMPRYVEGHDMLLCNEIEIHYDNTDSSTRQQSNGVHIVDDFAISEDDENTIIWTWSIPQHATKFVGSLVFAFRFACLTDAIVDYAWSTAPYSGIVIASSIYNGETIVEDYIDILKQWEQKIGVSVDDIKQTTISIEENGINVITLILSNGTRKSFQVRNGKTPVRGVDYWTEADKQEIIETILDVISVAEEASF